MRVFAFCAGLFVLGSGFACSCGTPAAAEGEGEGEGATGGEGEGAPGEGEGAPGEGEGEGTAGEGEGEGEGAGDTPPVVVITAPADGSSTPQNVAVTFAATVTDAEDGTIPAAQIVWTDDVEPISPLGTGATLGATLTVAGTHHVTCTATDSANVSTAASITITVTPNAAPTVTITAPANGSFFHPSDTIAFTATAFDPEDGNLSGASVVWSDNGAQLGIGTSVSTALATTGAHTITATATDSLGATGSASITVNIADNIPPQCRITSPAPPASVVQGTTVSFVATCTDPDGTGPIANASIVWTSDVQGQLGIGATVTTALVDIGVNHVTVCATDTVDPTLQGCSEVDVDVQANQPPVVTINSPADGATFSACDLPISLSCSAVDPNPGQVSTFAWTDNGALLSNNRNTQFTPTTAGQHVLTCTATDPLGASGSATSTVTVTSTGAVILQPASGAVVTNGTATNLQGKGCSLSSPNLPGVDLTWTDGTTPIGTGNVVNTVLSPGTHTITLTANDGTGTGTDSILVIVDNPPTVSISAPTAGQTVDSNNAVTFTGSATDIEDGVLVPTWTDSQNGVLGSSNQVVTTILPGKHTTTLSATDSVGATSTTSVTFFATPGAAPLSSLFSTKQGAGFVNDLLFDPLAGGRVWGGTGLAFGGGGIGVDDIALDLATVTTFDTNASLPSNTVNDVAVDGAGNVWLATDAGIASDCDAATFTTCNTIDQNNSQLQSNFVLALALLPDGRVLAATGQGLYFLDPATGQDTNMQGGDGQGDGLRASTILDVAYDAVSGQVWVVTDNGVSLMTPSVTGVNPDAQRFDDANVQGATGVRVAPLSGDAWFTTDGVIRHQGGRNGTNTRFRTNDGLPSNAARDIAFDVLAVGANTDEIAWVATSGGLGRIDVSTAPASVIAITTADGLPSNNLFAVTVEVNLADLAGSSHAKVLSALSGGQPLLIRYTGF